MPDDAPSAPFGDLIIDDEDAREKITTRFALFDTYVRRAEAAAARRDFRSAAVEAATSAMIATSRHCGIFASPRLERLINAIGAEIPDTLPPYDGWSAPKRYKKILHVGTHLTLGGVTRLISRWTDADRSRSYSLALTQQRGAIPDQLVTSIAASGGRIVELNRSPGGMFAWARRLRELAREFDAIVLNIGCEDVIPLIAFADPTKHPPVILLNHADHLFWLGGRSSHLVINLRDAATDIAIDRRGIEEKRNVLVPTIVEPVARTRSRREAKLELGLNPDTVLLVSIARGVKYHSIQGVTYADWHVEALRRHPNASLIAVGPGKQDDWVAAQDAVGGRIVALPETPDPRIYFEAADIYVDSYPFVSSTSMMEAAAYDTPLVTLFTAPDAARIFAINHVGLVGTAITARSSDEYTEALSRLIADEGYREQMGRAAGDAIRQQHAPPGWLDHLEAAFTQSAELPPFDRAALLASTDVEEPCFGEPDRRHQEIFGFDFDTRIMLMNYMVMAPGLPHLRYWMELLGRGAFANPLMAMLYLAPEWIKRVIKDRR